MGFLTGVGFQTDAAEPKNTIQAPVGAAVIHARWKTRAQIAAAPTGATVRVCHFDPRLTPWANRCRHYRGCWAGRCRQCRGCWAG